MGTRRLGIAGAAALIVIVAGCGVGDGGSGRGTSQQPCTEDHPCKRAFKLGAAAEVEAPETNSVDQPSAARGTAGAPNGTLGVRVSAVTYLSPAAAGLEAPAGKRFVVAKVHIADHSKLSLKDMFGYGNITKGDPPEFLFHGSDGTDYHDFASALPGDAPADEIAGNVCAPNEVTCDADLYGGIDGSDAAKAGRQTVDGVVLAEIPTNAKVAYVRFSTSSADPSSVAFASWSAK